MIIAGEIQLIPCATNIIYSAAETATTTATTTTITTTTTTTICCIILYFMDRSKRIRKRIRILLLLRCSQWKFQMFHAVCHFRQTEFPHTLRLYCQKIHMITIPTLPPLPSPPTLNNLDIFGLLNEENMC